MVYSAITGKSDVVAIFVNRQGITLKLLGLVDIPIHIPWTGIKKVKQERNDRFLEHVHLVLSEEAVESLGDFGKFGDGNIIHLYNVQTGLISVLVMADLVKMSKETARKVTYESVNYQPAEKKKNIFKRLLAKF